MDVDSSRQHLDPEERARDSAPDVASAELAPDARYPAASAPWTLAAPPVQLAALDTALIRFHTSAHEGSRSAGWSLAATPAQSAALDRALVQFKAATSGRAREDEDVHRTAARGAAEAGGQLPHLETIQRSFGRHDVSGVRAHRGAAADEATRALGARAYASGESVVLGVGGADLHTVAHEAAHVVQQRGGVQLAGGLGQAGDRYERHADAVADLVVAGRSAESLLDGMAPGGVGSTAGRGVQLKETDDGGGEDERAQIVKVAERARRPGRDVKFDAIQIGYRLLRLCPPDASKPYEISGVGYNEALDGIKIERDREAKSPVATVVIGKAFVLDIRAANVDDKVAELLGAFDAVRGSAAGTIDAAVPGVELEQLSASFKLNAGTLLEVGVWVSVEVPEHGATGRLTLTADALRFDVTPYIFIDAALPENATFHGFTYRFGDSGQGAIEVVEGRDIRKAGVKGLIGDYVVTRGAKEIRKLVGQLLEGTTFAAPGFNPFEASKDDFEAGAARVMANLDALKKSKAGHEEDAAAEDEADGEGYGLGDVSDVSVSARIRYKPGVTPEKGATGVRIAEGGVFDVSVETEGDAAAIQKDKFAGAKIKRIAAETSEVGLVYAGHQIASFHGAEMRRGKTIETDVRLDPSEDLLAVLRKENPSWFTESLDETISAIDLGMEPFVLIVWGLGGDVMNAPSGEPPKQAVRKAAVRAAMAYLQELVEYLATVMTHEAMLAGADIVATKFDVDVEDVREFLGVKPLPDGVSMLSMLKVATGDKCESEALGGMMTSISAEAQKIAAQAREFGAQVGDLVAIAEELQSSAKDLAEGVGGFVDDVKKDAKALGDEVDKLKKDMEGLADGVGEAVDEVEGVVDGVGSLIDGLGDIGSELGALGDLL